MGQPFAQSMRSLAADGGGRSVGGTACMLVLLGAWLAWFVRAEVTEYEVSDTARIEVGAAPHPIDAPVSGRVVAVGIVLGAEVKAGDVIVELDTESEKRRLAEERTRLTNITPELEAVRRVLDAQERSLTSDRMATLTALDEGRAKQHEAELGAILAADEARRASKLLDGGAIPEVELLRARADAEKRRAATDALALGVVRQKGDQQTRESQVRALMEDLRRDVTSLETRRATTQSQIDVLQHEIDRRTIRATIAGHVGDILPMKVGSYVREGEKLATIVPYGELKVVSTYAPAKAIGRIRAGQEARVRLDGYPWTQFGTVTATVAQVANEPRDGRIRVELRVIKDPQSKIALEHGLPGVAEVAVERISPATLVLRAVGRLLAPRPPAPPPDGPKG